MIKDFIRFLRSFGVKQATCGLCKKDALCHDLSDGDYCCQKCWAEYVPSYRD